MKTGIAPNWIIGLTVVGKPAATVITSSPFLIARSFNFGEVNVEKATRFADDPEFTVIKDLIPINDASSCSKLVLNLPDVNQPSREASPYS